MVSAEKMLQELGVRAKKASRELNRLGVKRKNEGLEAVAKALILHQDKILAATAVSYTHLTLPTILRV